MIQKVKIVDLDIKESRKAGYSQKDSIYYRDETNDIKPIKEIFNDTYTLAKFIKKGDIVLDLGAHIGSFTRYANLKGANTLSFEPNPDNFKILEKNAGLADRDIDTTCLEKCVTTEKSGEITFYFNEKKTEDRYRFTKIASPGRTGQMTFDNLDVQELLDMQEENQTSFDFIKMDIEGSEFQIIDEDRIPACDNIMIEYHLTKDKNMENFRRRFEIIKKKFKYAWVSFDRLLEKDYFPNDTYNFYFDHFIYASNFYSKKDMSTK